MVRRLQIVGPHVESLKQNDAYADVTFVDVDVEENLDVKEAFKINDLPTSRVQRRQIAGRIATARRTA